MKVKVDCFKITGKWHHEFTYKTKLTLYHEIVEEVRDMRDEARQLPGLVADAVQFHLLVRIKGNCVPRLIPYKGEDNEL